MSIWSFRRDSEEQSHIHRIPLQESTQEAALSSAASPIKGFPQEGGGDVKVQGEEVLREPAPVLLMSRHMLRPFRTPHTRFQMELQSLETIGWT